MNIAGKVRRVAVGPGRPSRVRPRRAGRPTPELDPTGFERLEHAVEDAAVVMQMAVERRPEAVDEAHRPEARPRRGPRTALAQMGLDHAQEDEQHGAGRPWLRLPDGSGRGRWAGPG